MKQSKPIPSGAWRLLPCALTIVSATGVAAADWAALGARVVKTSAEEGRTRLLVADGKGFQFSVSHTGDLTDGDAARIMKLRRRFLTWSIGPVRTINFLLSGPTIEALVLPEKASCGAKDMTELLPAGLLFRETDTLEYNFRLTIQNLFVRIKGVYISEAELCSKLSAAAENPREYIRQRDPEYILLTLDRLKARLDDLAGGQDRLRRAVIALHNRSFFSGPRPVQEKTVRRVVALKKETPGLTAEQLSDKLKSEGILLSAEETELILNVYYGQFKK